MKKLMIFNNKDKFNDYKITTVIPVYNQEKHLEKALKSIVNQRRTPFELLIINDASTDDTQLICEKFQMSYTNIRTINLTENMGVSNARNIGIKYASGDYIHFMDSDDTIEEDMYENILKNIKNKEKDLIITGTRYNENNKINIYIPQKRDINTLKEMQDFLKCNCIIGRRNIFNVVWNKLYKREFLTKNNIRFDKDISFGEDFLFNLECMKKTNSIYVINRAYYNYIRNPNEITLKMKFLDEKINLRRLFYKKWIEFYDFYNIYESVSKKMQIYEGFKIYMAIISVANNNCPLNYDEKLEYINDFIHFENSDCLFKYMEKKRELRRELDCLKNGKLEEFYSIIENKR